jgi:ankyrin repeat protein
VSRALQANVALSAAGVLYECGLPPLHLAAARGEVGVLWSLLLDLRRGGSAAAKLNQPSPLTLARTPLVEAVAGGHGAAVRMLSQHGASVESIDADGRTPLSIAAKYGYAAMTTVLLECGARVDRKIAGGGYTPLYIASQEGHTAVVEALLEAGADVERASDRGYTPLFSACQAGHAPNARLLVIGGADVERATSSGITPLFIAAQLGHAEVAEVLLQAGESAAA